MLTKSIYKMSIQKSNKVILYLYVGFNLENFLIVVETAELKL